MVVMAGSLFLGPRGAWSLSVRSSRKPVRLLAPLAVRPARRPAASTGEGWMDRSRPARRPAASG